MQTLIEAQIPRVQCAEHGIVQVRIPWADARSGFTALFEAMVISWLRNASILAVSGLIGISWDEVDGIMQRAVDRGLKRRELKPFAHLGLDETSYRKRHDYVTIILDRASKIVVDVLDDRTKECLVDWFKNRPDGHNEAIETVSMDMWHPYI
jgi:transposase